MCQSPLQQKFVFYSTPPGHGYKSFHVRILIPWCDKLWGSLLVAWDLILFLRTTLQYYSNCKWFHNTDRRWCSWCLTGTWARFFSLRSWWTSRCCLCPRGPRRCRPCKGWSQCLNGFLLKNILPNSNCLANCAVTTKKTCFTRQGNSE